MDTNNTQGNPLAVEPQDEQLPVAVLATVAVIGLVVFAAGIFWSFQIQKSVEGTVHDTFGPPRVADQIGKPEIGMVDQVQFDNEKRAAEMRAAKIGHLDTAGWVSQRQKIVHIPITTAMDAIAAGKQVRQPTQPGETGPGAPAPSPTPTP